MKYQLINKFISKIKGENFNIDYRIPRSYLFHFIFVKFTYFVVGHMKLRRLGFFFISPSTKLYCASKIYSGKNLNIAENCYINALSCEGIKFGSNVSIGKNTTIECSGTLKNIGKGLIVGNNVGLGTHCFYGCAGGIEIGNDTIVGNLVSFHSENHNFSRSDIPIRLQGVNRKGIKVGNGCWIGAKVTVLDGAIIPDNCIIAAGAVVTEKINETIKWKDTIKVQYQNTR